MSAIRLTVHGTGSGVCSLMGKEGDGLTVTFEDGTVQQAFLSWKGLRQLLAMKASQATIPEARHAAAGNGIAAE
jgi:hypothetical protein